MTNKKAIELSLNFIVILIISIVLFGFGVLFIRKLSSQAVELQDITITELDEKIGSLVCEGSDRVCIGIDKKIIKPSKFDVFGLKIINILDNQHFEIVVKPANPIGYTKLKQPIQTSGSFHGLLIAPPIYSEPGRDVVIDKNEEKSIGIGIQVPANAVSGTYIFDVTIKTSDGTPYTSDGTPHTQKLYVDVPQ